MSKYCEICGAEMQPLLNELFCPNNCDKKANDDLWNRDSLSDIFAVQPIGPPISQPIIITQEDINEQLNIDIENKKIHWEDMGRLSTFSVDTRDGTFLLSLITDKNTVHNYYINVDHILERFPEIDFRDCSMSQFIGKHLWIFRYEDADVEYRFVDKEYKPLVASDEGYKRLKGYVAEKLIYDEC